MVVVVSPMTLPAPPAFDAGDDRGQETNMDALCVDVRGDGCADQRAGDVVEEGRHHEHKAEQRQAAGPAIGQDVGRQIGQLAFFEMTRQQGKAQQQQTQICQFDPMVIEVRYETIDAGPVGEANEEEFVGEDRQQSDHSDGEGAMVKQRHAEQRGGEQDELDGNSEHGART
jgi:hypothetical protein